MLFAEQCTDADRFAVVFDIKRQEYRRTVNINIMRHIKKNKKQTNTKETFSMILGI